MNQRRHQMPLSTLFKKVFPLYFVLSILAMYPSSFQMATYKFGPLWQGSHVMNGSDSLGIINSLWCMVNQSTINESNGFWTYYQGYPEGAKLHIHEPTKWIAALCTYFVNPVFGYNILIFISFLLSGSLMHFLLYRFLGLHWIALFGGFTYMFSPFHIAHSADHINLAQTWVFPAFMILFFSATENKDYKGIIRVSLFSLFVLLIHGYYAAYLFFILSASIFYLLLTKKLRISMTKKHFLFFTLITLLFTLLVAGLLYYIGIFKFENGEIVIFSRSIEDFHSYGIRGYEFIIPPIYSLFFGKMALEFLSQHSHGSNYTEMSLFLGYIPILLSIYLLFSIKSYKKTTNPGNHYYIGYFSKWHLAVILIIGILPFLLGIPPEIEVFNQTLPTPTKLLFIILPMLRTLSRIGILTIFSVSCFASIGLYLLIKKKPAYSKLIVLSLVIAVFLEFTPMHAKYYSDAFNIPPVYKSLKEIKGDVVVFEMPFVWGYIPDFWQTYHHKPLFNRFGKNHSNFNKGHHISQQKKLSQMIRLARSYGIDYLIIHRRKPLPIQPQYENRLNNQSILPIGAKYSYLIKVK